MKSSCSSGRGATAFTLVEILVVASLIAVLVFVMSAIVNQANKIWRSTRGKAEQFRNSRLAFDVLTQQLGQATLNTYWCLVDASNQPRTGGNAGSFLPSRYVRQSELRFLCGNAAQVFQKNDVARPSHAIFFQAPLGFTIDAKYQGMENVLNTQGFFIEYGEDPSLRPAFVSGSAVKRFRLMEMMEPSESLTLYKYTSGTDSTGKVNNASYLTNPVLPNGASFARPGGVSASSSYTGREWFTDSLYPSSGTRPVHVLAENVIALVLLPKLSPQETASGTIPALSPKYSYDSTVSNADSRIDSWNQLPPVVQMTMVAIDEDSAARMSEADCQNLIAKIATLFSDSNQLTADLMAPPAGDVNSLESYLIKNRIHYRIFTSSVSIKAAKWSREQCN